MRSAEEFAKSFMEDLRSGKLDRPRLKEEEGPEPTPEFIQEQIAGFEALLATFHGFNPAVW